MAQQLIRGSVAAITLLSDHGINETLLLLVAVKENLSAANSSGRKEFKPAETVSLPQNDTSPSGWINQYSSPWINPTHPAHAAVDGRSAFVFLQIHHYHYAEDHGGVN